MKNILALLLLLSIPFATTFAQSNTMSKASDSDKEATAILDKARDKYENLKTLEVDFSTILELPERPKDIQKGKLIQKGENYHLEIPTQTITCDGEAVYVYFKNRNEVQINDVLSEEEAEGEMILSPKDLFSIYEKGKYVYALVNQIAEKGKLLQQIEFKPIPKDSEYAKIRVSIDKKTNDIVRIKSFYKDGTRYTIKVDKMSSNKTYASDMFKFDTSKYPDVYVEDLRENPVPPRP